MSYEKKYLKYKSKYFALQKQLGSANPSGMPQHTKFNKARFLDLLINNKSNGSPILTDEYIERRRYKKSLVKLLADTLETNINECEKQPRKIDKVDSLYNAFCHIQLLYEPIANNITSLINNNKLLNGSIKIGEESVYGSVFKKNIEEKTVIIKVPNKYSKDLIIEAVVNLCIINDYIIRYPLNNNLVFTYGLFFCPMNTDKFNRDNKLVKLSICYLRPNNSDKLPSVHLIQEYLGNDSITLLNIFKKNIPITLDEFKIYISQIFSQLADLEEGPYELIHNDLHTNNIMIKNNKPYIIDWGNSSFTCNGERIKSINNHEKDYSIDDNTYKSAIYDVFIFISNIKRNIKNNQLYIDIYRYIDEILNSHIYNKIYKSKDRFLNNTNIGNLIWIYELLDLNTFELNKKYFKSITYDYALKNIFKVERVNRDALVSSQTDQSVLSRLLNLVSRFLPTISSTQSLDSSPESKSRTTSLSPPVSAPPVSAPPVASAPPVTPVASAPPVSAPVASAPPPVASAPPVASVSPPSSQYTPPSYIYQ